MDKVKLGAQPLLFPLPVVLVGVNVDDKANFMTASWCGIASYKPPAITVGIMKGRYTLEGIRENGTFSVSIPSTNLVEKVDYCGIYSGKKRDKSQIFETSYGDLKTAPLINECPVNLECKVLHSLDVGSHFLIVGEIKETHVNENCLTDEKPDAEKIDPVIFSIDSQKYRRLGEVFADAFQVGKKLIS